MSEAYLVRVKSSSGKDAGDTLQVVADGPEQAEAAVRAAVHPSALVEAEREPVSGDQAVERGVISGKVLLS